MFRLLRRRAARQMLAAGAGALLAGGGSAQAPRAYRWLIGNDWRGYANTAELRAASLFWAANHDRAEVNRYVDLVADSTFGQVARVTQPADPNPQARNGFSPELRAKFPVPLDNAWFRFRVRFSPGWTTAGPYPAGAANSYKLAFIVWREYGHRSQIEFTNTRQYALGFSFEGVNCSRSRLPASTDWGHVTSEWSGGEWWEFIMYYEKVGPTSARHRWWRRQLTRNGRIVENPFDFAGSMRTDCDRPTPQARAVFLGVNKNKTTPVTQYLYWGPWEVVDGSVYAYPFHLPNVN